MPLQLPAGVLSSMSIMGMRGGVLVAKLWLSLFIARYLGLEALGLFGLVVGIAAVGQAVMRLGLFEALGREAVGQPLNRLTSNLRHYLTGSAVLYSVLLLLVALGGAWFGVLTLAVLAFLVMLTEHACRDVFVLTNNLQRPALANGFFALQSAGWIYLYMAAAYLFPALRSLEVLLGFWIAGGALTAAAALLATRRWPWKAAFSEPIRTGWYLSYLGKAWRLHLSEIVAIANLYVDRYLVSVFLSLELAGLYVLFWQVSNALCNLVGAGVLQVYRPRLILAWSQQDRLRFRALHRECALRCAIAVVGLAGICALVVPLFAGYAQQPLAGDHLPLLWLLLLFACLRVAADLSIAALFAQAVDGPVLAGNLLALAMTLLLGSLALPLFGVHGAALAAICTCLITIGYTETARRHIGHEGFSSHRTRRTGVPQDGLPLLDRDPCQEGR